MTLHKTIEFAHKVLKLMGGIIGGLILFFILYNAGLTIKESFFPTPPSPPTTKFGILPFPGFPQSKVKTPLTYTINTITGKLPLFNDRVNVYKLAQPQPNLLGLEKAKSIAQKNGFLGNPVPLSDSVFLWNNATPPASLTYNILTNSFTYKSDYMNDATVLAAKNIPPQQLAADYAKTFITNYTLFPTDISPSTSQVSFFAIQNHILVPASSSSQAHIIRVDFPQQDVNKIPLYYATYPQSPLYVLIASGENQPKIVEANFDYEGVLTDFSETYPIKTAAKAFDELKNGQAYIARYDGQNTNVTINSVTLGYYLANSQQAYLIPIIVFSGDKNFSAFVSAVTDTWVNTSSNQQ